MVSFLFWNVYGVASTTERKGSTTKLLSSSTKRYHDLEQVLQDLASNEALDVIVLVESPFAGHLAVKGFSEAKTTLLPSSRTGTRVEIYHRDTVAFTGFDAADRTVMHDMTVTASGQTVQMVSTHLDSSLHHTDEHRETQVRILSASIRDREQRIGHERTLLIGDLNYDPHDPPVTAAQGLNGVPAKLVAKGALRGTMPYFYNPMWRHLTDVTPDPPGTYYYSSKDFGCRYWYLFDQVLIRPSLLDFWNDSDLRIVSTVGMVSLLNKVKHPAKTRFSDHLPITFALNL